ncbi:MAG TPA: hypothetical protein VF808_04000 [Ktedonobacterales bacterium]
MRFSPTPDTDLPVKTPAPASPPGPLGNIEQPARPGGLRGAWAVWLRLAAPPLRNRDPDSPATRLIERRRALAASLLFGLSVLWTVLVPVTILTYPNGLADDLLVSGIGYLTLGVVGWFIRRGWITSAAMVLIALIFAGFLSIQQIEPQSALQHATAFYILLYPILLAATLMPAEALFITLAADLLLVGWSALIIWPAAVRLESLIGLQSANIYIWPVAALIIVTVVAYIWTSGMQRATAQAEFARLNAMLLRASEAGAREALEHDVRELVRVIDSWSTDNLGAEAGPLANADLRRVAIALSGYAGRARALAKDQFDLQREREASQRVAEAILYYRQGMPATWPAATGLPVDAIVRAIVIQDPRRGIEELNQSQP